MPFTEAAKGELKKTVVTNIVALGALVEVSGMLPADAVERAVLNRVPERFRELNEQAFRLGARLASEAQATAASRRSRPRRRPRRARRRPQRMDLLEHQGKHLFARRACPCCRRAWR